MGRKQKSLQSCYTAVCFCYDVNVLGHQQDQSAWKVRYRYFILPLAIIDYGCILTIQKTSFKMDDEILRNIEIKENNGKCFWLILNIIWELK